MRVRLRPTQRAPTTPATPIAPASSDPHGRPRAPDDANRAPTLNGMPAPRVNRELVSAPGLSRAVAARVRRIPTRRGRPHHDATERHDAGHGDEPVHVRPGSGSIDRSTPSGNLEVRAYATSPAIGAAAMAAMPPSTARSTARSRRRQPRAGHGLALLVADSQGSAHHLRDDHGRREHGDAVTTHSAVAWKRTARRALSLTMRCGRGVRVVTVRQLVDRVHHVARVAPPEPGGRR